MEQLTLFEGWPAKRYRARRLRHSDQPWRTALHEAGHATMAHLLRIPFEQISVRPSLGRSLGRVIGDFPGFLLRESSIPRAERKVAIAMVLVAGEVAAERFALRPIERIRCPGSDYDQLYALLGGSEVPFEQLEPVVLEVEKMVGKCLTESDAGAMVLRLAAALTRRITLDFEEAIQAMAGNFEYQSGKPGVPGSEAVMK